MKLHDIATARAGDKGDTAQIAVIARGIERYPLLVEWLTAERVHAALAPIGARRVTRHEVPGLLALMFLAEGALGGGVSISLASDPHGKSLSSLILAIELPEEGAAP
ncbi:MAG: AtuA-related protein [Beijerinckiaceae bacterium]